MCDKNVSAPELPLILIVDDNSRNIQVAAGILRNIKCRISIADSGRGAVDSVRRLTPDLVLLDVMMPEMDGFEVCRLLKHDDGTADIPIIFVTAKTEAAEIVRGFRAGAVDYITKPFKSEELLARVNVHLSLRLALREQRRLNRELRRSIEEMKTLASYLPICSYCKKIRDDEGYWQEVEAYITTHSGSKFSHTICKECLAKHFPQYSG